MDSQKILETRETETVEFKKSLWQGNDHIIDRLCQHKG